MDSNSILFWKGNADVDKEKKSPFLAFSNCKCLMKRTELNFPAILTWCTYGEKLFQSQVLEEVHYVRNHHVQRSVSQARDVIVWSWLHSLQKTQCFTRALMACLSSAYLPKCEHSYLEYLPCFYKLIGLNFHEASTQATHELGVWGSQNGSEHNGPCSQGWRLEPITGGKNEPIPAGCLLASVHAVLWNVCTRTYMQAHSTHTCTHMGACSNTCTHTI